MSKKSLKIFFQAMDSVGHINACIGLAQTLAERGHQIIFLTDLIFAGYYKKYGFQEIVLVSKRKQELMDGKNTEEAVKIHPLKPTVADFLRLRKSGLLSGKPPIEKLQPFDPNKKESLHRKLYEELMETHQQIIDAIEQEKPDLIIVDSFVIDPYIAYGKTPWALLSSCNPNFLFESEDLPPIHSGYPSNDRTGWQEFREKFNKTNRLSMNYYQSKLNQDLGYPKVDPNQYLFKSPFMNIYAYPEELDYHDVIKIPENIVRMDAFCLKSSEPFEFPEEFKSKIKPEDKLIYLSLGSMGAIDTDLMRRLVSHLSKSPHKFIVSMGPLHEEYQLADNNMWGQAYLPQTQILPLVDLVITHGGNNTITEALSFGKPMLVMPLFSDQHDNAQRILEKGYGKRINPHYCTETELNQIIDDILNDQQILERCEKAGKRMRQAQSKEKACEKIEQILENLSTKTINNGL